MTDASVGDDDPSAAFRLPYSVEPRRYELRLAPDLDAARFTGDVRIDAVAVEKVTEIVMHGAELTIAAASVSQGDAPAIAATTELDEAGERLTLRLETPVEPGPLTVFIAFAGILNDKLHGFYRSTFVDGDGVSRTIATSQLEATDARRAFPCFDEPDRKAVFSVTLDVPAGLAAFSNGPPVTEEALDGGRRRIRFGDTIPMSTYLVAFVVGPFLATEPVVAVDVPIRVVHVPGKEGLTRFALEVAEHALTFFSEWFGIPYPAEKLDLLAVPDFSFGAMENLGCVTFRETALLVDPARASRPELERVAVVVAHEIAHMWFGDLVTMKWWNGIWLNEAFATFMELLCVDAFRPEWEHWLSFGRERDVAMATDALHSTRPVEYPVGPPEEAQGMLDVLTYQKGAGVLRMLERYLGAEPFKAGIRRYLAAHRFGNTETTDLWDAIEEASSEPVRAMMDTWILQGGFPLVSVAPDAPGAVVLSQAPFSYQPPDPAGTSAIGNRWQIPVLVRAIGGGESKALMADESHTVAVGAANVGTGDGAVVVNAGGSGFYRVAYSEAALGRLTANLDALTALERFNLCGDTWAAVMAGRVGLEAHLALAEAVTDDDPDVWAQISGPLGLLDLVLDDATRRDLASYVRLLLGPVLDRVGWEPGPDEAERTPKLRAQMISALGTIGEDVEVRQRADALFAMARAGTSSLPPDSASAVLGVVASSGGAAQFDAFVDAYRHPETPQEEIRYLMALTGFRDDELAGRAFDMAMTEVRTQNAPFFISALLANRFTGAGTWARVVDHWDEILARLPAANLSSMLSGVRSLCREARIAESVAEFLHGHPVAVGQRSVAQTLERLSINVAFAERMRVEARGALTAGASRLGAD